MFADPIDRSSHFQEEMLQHQINNIRTRKRELTPNGTCYYCYEKVDNQRLFCDEFCSEDYEKLKRAQRMR